MAYLEGRGSRILHFSNEQVLTQMTTVLAAIRAHL